MSESMGLSPEEMGIEQDGEKFKDFTATLEQVTTRGDGKLELGESFSKDQIDFKASLDHLKIHQSGEVAGSQFNGAVVSSPEQVKQLLEQLLPDQLQFDQFGRAEITLSVTHPGTESLGWAGVKSTAELQQQFPDVQITQELRMAGGEPATEDGVEGAWYPETERDPATGRFVVVKDEQGNVKNPHGKFEPVANIASVPAEEFREAAKTDKLTVILQKDRETSAPVVLTVFPGDNAPAFPTKINSENYKASSLGDSNEAKYWQEHVFIKTQ